MADMTVNLDQELSAFKERIRADGSVRVTRVGGTAEGGGGAADTAMLALIILTGIGVARSRPG